MHHNDKIACLYGYCQHYFRQVLQRGLTVILRESKQGITKLFLAHLILLCTISRGDNSAFFQCEIVR